MINDNSINKFYGIMVIQHDLSTPVASDWLKSVHLHLIVRNASFIFIKVPFYVEFFLVWTDLWVNVHFKVLKQVIKIAA